MSTAVEKHVQKHCDGLRSEELRSVQFRASDICRPGFDEECRRQCMLVDQADHDDIELQRLMDEAWADLEDRKL